MRKPKALRWGTPYIVLGNTWKVIMTRRLVWRVCNLLRKALLPRSIGRRTRRPRLNVHRPIGSVRSILRRCFTGPLGTATILMTPQLFLIKYPRSLIVNLGAFTHMTSKLLPPTPNPRHLPERLVTTPWQSARIRDPWTKFTKTLLALIIGNT